MTIAANDRLSGPYVCTGGETVLAYDFLVLASADLVVRRLRAGVVTTLSLGTDYTVAGVGVSGGGSVSLVTPALAADRYVVKGARAVARTTSLVSERDLSATKLNSEYDNLEIQVQELFRIVSQALRRSDFSTSSIAFELPDGNGMILVNADGSASFVDPAGITGPAGPANVLTVGTVTTGSPGSSAAVTITGTAPSQTINLTIPRGDVGPTGATGSTGLTGDTGPANTLTVGTVTTGAAGSNVTVTITGTAPSQTINLTIPRGDAGATGAAGAAVQYDRERGELEKRAHNHNTTVPSAVTAVTRNADRTYTHGASSDLITDIPVTAAMLASGNVWVAARLVSGSLSTATYEQRNAGGSIVAPANLTLEANRYIVRGLTINASTTLIRVRLRTGVGGAAVHYAPAIGQGEPATAATDPALAAFDALAHDAVTAATNWWDTPSAVTNVGSAPVRTGGSWAVASGSSIDLNMAVGPAAFVAADTFAFMVEIVGAVAQAWLKPYDASVSVNTYPLLDLGGGFWGCTGVAAAGSGGLAGATTMTLRLDTRTDSQRGYTAQAVTARNFWLAKGVTSWPGSLRLPAPVSAAFTRNRIGIVYVDALNGSDTDAGTDTQPLATLTAALATGAAVIMARAVGTHRISSTIAMSALKRIRFSAWRKTGDTATRARILGSVNVPAASWTALGSPWTGMYYYATATDPGGLWEIDAAGNTTRMYYNAKAVGTPNPQAADQTQAYTQAGAYWYGTGSAGAGIYMMPWAGTITGKSYEVAVATNGLTFTDCADVELRDIEVAHTRDQAVALVNSTGRGENCRFGRNGNVAGQGNGLQLSNAASWMGFGNHHEDCGNDGVGHVANAAVTHTGCRFENNRGDGASADGTGSNIRAVACEGIDNGKNGFVRIKGGDTAIQGGRYTGNLSQDIAVNFAGQGAETANKFECTGVSADWTYFDAGASGTINANLRQHNGAVEVNGAGATVAVNGLDCRKVVKATLNYGARVNSGSLDIQNFKITGAINGLMATGGTLKARQGNVLRNTTGFFQSGSPTIDLDLADPVNVYGNTTQFSGVSAPDQAKTVSVAAV